MQKLTFHHVGFPTSETLPEGSYDEALQHHASGYFDTPYGIEWMSFDEDNDLPDIIKKVPHVAFVVENLAEAIKGKHIIMAPNSPVDGVTVAFILDGKNLIELMQFDRPEYEIWPHPNKFCI